METLCTYFFCLDAHFVEFLLVVRAGLGAVVCHEDELFAWSSVNFVPLSVSRPSVHSFASHAHGECSYLSASASQSYPVSPGTSDHPTTARLSFSYRQRLHARSKALGGAPSQSKRKVYIERISESSFVLDLRAVLHRTCRRTHRCRLYRRSGTWVRSWPC